MKWGSKEWANDQLRFAIKIVDDRLPGYDCRPSGRLADALAIKDRLKDHGFTWQANILSHHIHRAQKRSRKTIVGLRRIQR